MTQRDKEQAITDLIADLMRPEPMPKYEPVQHDSIWTKMLWFVLWFALPMFGVMMLWYWYRSGDGLEDERTRQFISILVMSVAIGLGMMGVHLHTSRLQLLEAQEKSNDLAFARQIRQLREEQRVALLQSLSATEIQRHVANASFNATHLESMWKEREMTFTSSEAEKQRLHEKVMQGIQSSADIAEIDKRLGHEMEMLEKRLKHEKTPAAERTAESLIMVKGMRGVLETIHDVGATNPVVGEQMFKMWQRGAF